MITRRAILAAGLATPFCATAATRPPPAALPLSRLDLPWWKQRFLEKQQALNVAPCDVAFYGDSITQFFEQKGPEPWRNYAPIWDRFYAGRKALNFGFKGDATSHLLWRIENGETTGISPRAAVVLIGANNFGKLHWPAEPSFAGIEAVMSALLTRLPKTQFMLLAVLPSIRPQRGWVDVQTAAINAMMAQRYGHGAEKRISYRNLAPIFMKNGAVDPAAFMDIHLTPPDPPLHPSPDSARKMLAAIEPWMAHVLGDKARL
jgi:hypothetical protein